MMSNQSKIRLKEWSMILQLNNNKISAADRLKIIEDTLEALRSIGGDDDNNDNHDSDNDENENTRE